MKAYAIIVAAGSSSRMGSGKAKILEKICGKTVIEWTLQAFQAAESITGCVVVCRETELPILERLFAGRYTKPVRLVLGGDTRQASVQRGIAAADIGDFFAIHDGARPLVTPELIDRVCMDAETHGAAAAAVHVKDTCKIVDARGFVQETPNRDALMAVQTPQVFQRGIYLAAAEKARKSGQDFTDDCQLLECAGYPVYLTQGDNRNIKITTAEDLQAAGAYLAEGSRDMRIGYGYDVHRLTAGRKLILGGVEIPFEKGLLGHSDADVLCHAIADALLGAAALGDIGKLFPDTDRQFQDADSLVLLKTVVEKLRENGFAISNIDATIAAQRPKLMPYILQMRENLAGACGLELRQISVKATTEEGMGFTGSEAGMSAAAVCMVFSI